MSYQLQYGIGPVDGSSLPIFGMTSITPVFNKFAHILNRIRGILKPLNNNARTETSV
jgi:hypothetical protein